jgi:signal transduction histidine kinase/ActR/RegA family two-component response regulator
LVKSTLSLADVIRQQRDRILARFVHDVERSLSPEGLSRPMLVDHVPAFLDEVARELDAVRSGHEAREASATARVHGTQRWSLGFDLEALIREYAVLHRCILGTAKDVGAPPNIDDYDVLAQCLSVGVAEAVGAYTRHRDEEVTAQRERLEFLAEAGQLLSSSLDYRSTTRRLTMLVVPRMADWCAIHLEGVPETEMPLAHVDPTKLALLRRLHVEFPPGGLSDGYLELVGTGEGKLIRETAPDFYESIARTPQHLEMMKELGTTSWIIVPLRVQEHTFGALMLAYGGSRRSYDDNDFALAREVARRAASAIDNAHLYDLSQIARARVEAATRAKDEFVAMVSHELRTPLNAILGWLRLMNGGTLDEAKRQHALDVIQRNAQAQDRLVADLLDISRIITGRLRIKLSQVDLSDVVEMAIETVRPAAETKRIRIEIDLDRENAVLRGDGERLEQVVWNLLANAVKFTPKSGVVRVRLRRVESDIELVVEDSGQGIEPSFLPHVFEVFQQQDQSFARPHGGLGIGLSIVKHIVDLHGGSITAHSAGKGTGATFSVRIPISPLISATLGVSRVPPAALTRDRTDLPTGLTDLHILVVDDDPDARELLTTMLESSGMEVRTAATVPEALALLAFYTPTVLCSDIGLRDDDGYALIRHVRSLTDPKKSSVPAIALTAFGRNDDRKRALVEGFNVHLTKPVEPATLVRVVLELAGRST